jgi:catechol-2,3-dioxygenase
MEVRRLKLRVDGLGALREFYHGRLGLRIVAETEQTISFQCGKSVLEFEPGEAAYYHFAFNIPSLAVTEAADWLEGLGIELIPFEGQRIVPFPNWVAEAVYFHDPAGNIVELIARRRLEIPRKESFDAASWVEISEIGLAVDTPLEVKGALTGQVGLASFWCPSAEFCALGDEQGLFIVVDASHKKWIPSMEPAKSFPLEAEIVQDGQAWMVGWQQEILKLNRKN